ncbi:hypothetical protein MST27_02040 [Pseudomonas sp. PS1]|uniref:Uncharacterized protein n=1 Tax=Stutzerimonas marianensis TaxID=2929513 RepID=A0A9X1W0Z5_9GAMM|nr:hypothetical protein [Pseudomonas marianensis]MCJ0972150.1 hypothetical protein [Pseudomonas marianensis]
MDEAIVHLSLKHAEATKTGKYATGKVSYRILTDAKHCDLFVVLVGNQGGGWYSKEIVPFDQVEAAAKRSGASGSVSSKQFRQCFVSRSVNNAGFLVAVLHAEGLLEPDAENANQHVLINDWSGWKEQLLALEGEPYAPALGKVVGPATLPADTAPAKSAKPRRASRASTGAASGADGQNPVITNAFTTVTGGTSEESDDSNS